LVIAKPFGYILKEARNSGQHVGRNHKVDLAVGWLTPALNP
jgi:hypothetical protein